MSKQYENLPNICCFAVHICEFSWFRTYLHNIFENLTHCLRNSLKVMPHNSCSTYSIFIVPGKNVTSEFTKKEEKKNYSWEQYGKLAMPRRITWRILMLEEWKEERKGKWMKLFRIRSFLLFFNGIIYITIYTILCSCVSLFLSFQKPYFSFLNNTCQTFSVFCCSTNGL